MGNAQLYEENEASSKIVFLDVDGVLNNAETDIYRADTIIHTDLLLILKRILQETNALLVLSSNWRYYEATRQRLNVFFASVGILPPLSCTPRLETNRTDEIICWLQDNTDFNKENLSAVTLESRVSKKAAHLRESSYKMSKRMHVTHWIALDDMDLTQEGKNTAYLMHRFIHVNKLTGLTEKDANLAIKLLNQ